MCILIVNDKKIHNLLFFMDYYNREEKNLNLEFQENHFSIKKSFSLVCLFSSELVIIFSLKSLMNTAYTPLTN